MQSKNMLKVESKLLKLGVALGEAANREKDITSRQLLSEASEALLRLSKSAASCAKDAISIGC